MAQNLSFSLDKEYELRNDGSDITLDVIFGDVGQSPDTIVEVDSDRLLTNWKQSINNLLVGNDKGLDGKILRIDGNIADTSRNSNKIDLRLKITGGTREINKRFSVSVEEEGEVVIFSFVIRFFV